MPFSLQGRDLKKNDTGVDVKELQRVLYLLNYDLGDSGPNKDGIDSTFGTLTENAVIDFQKTHFNLNMPSEPLEVDGIVGQYTADALNQVLQDESLFITGDGAIKASVFFPSLFTGLRLVVRGQEYKMRIVVDGFEL